MSAAAIDPAGFSQAAMEQAMKNSNEEFSGGLPYNLAGRARRRRRNLSLVSKVVVRDATRLNALRRKHVRPPPRVAATVATTLLEPSGEAATMNVATRACEGGGGGERGPSGHHLEVPGLSSSVKKWLEVPPVGLSNDEIRTWKLEEIGSASFDGKEFKIKRIDWFGCGIGEWIHDSAFNVHMMGMLADSNHSAVDSGTVIITSELFAAMINNLHELNVQARMGKLLKLWQKSTLTAGRLRMRSLLQRGQRVIAAKNIYSAAAIAHTTLTFHRDYQNNGPGRLLSTVGNIFITNGETKREGYKSIQLDRRR